MKHFFGIVEDRNDPLKIGRVRVRVHGIHTDNKLELSTPDLPCSSITSNNNCWSFRYRNATWSSRRNNSLWIFQGRSMQDPIIFGVAVGIPQTGYKVDAFGNELLRSVDKGFNDPRRLTVADYEGTPDAPNPEQDSRRPHGLTSAIDTQPKSPKEITINYDATGSTITEGEDY